MSNKAITTNDLKAVLDVVLPPQPSEYKKLLWTNPSPTSSFAAQTISGIDFSGYDEVEIEFAFNTADTTVRLFNKIQVGSKGHIETERAQPFYTQYREVTINSNSAVFGECILGSGTAYNDHNIPCKIYGIKYERVAPPQVEYPNYSTEEQQVGTWVTGKPLYRKVMPIQSLPNNTTGVYAHGISNIGVVSRFTLCWYDTNDGRFLMSPRIDAGGARCVATMNSTNVIIEATGTNWSTRTKDVFFIVEYTKTTD